MELTRKERAEIKRNELINKIYDVVKQSWRDNEENPDRYTKGLEAGDKFINDLINQKPQEKEFIRSKIFTKRKNNYAISYIFFSFF